MEKFIYVIGDTAADMMLDLGYQLLKKNESTCVYVFLNKEQQVFEHNDIPCVLSNVLTF